MKPTTRRAAALAAFFLVLVSSSVVLGAQDSPFVTLIKADDTQEENPNPGPRQDASTAQLPESPQSPDSPEHNPITVVQEPRQASQRRQADPKSDSTPQLRHEAVPANPVDAVLSKQPVETDELLSMLDRYPALVMEKLKSKPIELRGIVERIQVLGFENDRVEVTLQGRGSRHLILCDDVHSHGGFVDKPNDKKNEWITENHVLELCSLRRNGSKDKVSILSEDKPYETKVMLSSVSPSSLKFELVH